MHRTGTKKASRFTAGIMVIMVLFALLFSSFYLTRELGHDCCGEDCPVCACILQCEHTLRGMGGSLPLHTAVILAALILIKYILFSGFQVIYTTPVSRKIRLNN